MGVTAKPNSAFESGRSQACYAPLLAAFNADVMFQGARVSTPTVSEKLFEKLCAVRRVACVRIPETTERTADYRVSLRSLNLVAEVKQLDPSDADRELAKVWGTPLSPGSVGPSDRVQALLANGYAQIKRSSEGKWPTMIVVFNNSGQWNWIDTFAISKAMFGSYGIVLGLQPDQTIEVTGYGYMGERKVTKDTFRSLSVVGVLKRKRIDVAALECYHNPFAHVQIAPSALSELAEIQYVHPNPHARGFVQWEPRKIET